MSIKGLTRGFSIFIMVAIIFIFIYPMLCLRPTIIAFHTIKQAFQKKSKRNDSDSRAGYSDLNSSLVSSQEKL